MAADWHWEIWNRATDAVRAGESPAVAALGKPFFDWVHEDRPDAGVLFDGAMRSLSSVAGPLVVNAVELDGVTSICDAGGGTGRLLRSLLDAAPAARGTVFDLADVVSGAAAVLGDLASERWSTVGADFFTPGVIPRGHDRYLMQAIMHDWPDDKAGTILRNVRAAMSPDSRLWVVDSILDPSEGPDADTYYGYGWAIVPTPFDTWLITHNGGNGIFFADFLRFLDEDITIFLATNAARDSDEVAAYVVAEVIFGRTDRAQ